MKIVTFDLETVIDSERSEQIRPIIEAGLPSPEFWKHPDKEKQITYQWATTPEYCRVVSAAYTIGEDSPRGAAVNQEGLNGEPLTEADLIRGIWNVIRDTNHIVTFNGSWFDIRVLKFRSALLGIKPTRNLTDIKPWDSLYIDTFRGLYPNMKYTLSLKKAAKVFNLPVPAEFQPLIEEEVNGSEVAELWATQDLETLVKYNRMDVALTRELCRLFGGLYWSVIFLPWDNYDYQTGTWVGDPVEGF